MARTAVQMPLIARVLLLLALASPPLYGQMAIASPPEDAAPSSGTQQVQGISARQNQPRQPNQPQSPSPPPQGQNSEQGTPLPQPATILGTVTDVKDDPVPGAAVILEGPLASDRRTVATNDIGSFEIRDVEPGIPYHITISAKGFADWVSPVVILAPRENKILTVSKLRIEEVQTTVIVRPQSSEEIATEQVKVELKQRGFGIIPNFFAVYVPNPAPLTTNLKFRLSFKVMTDPATLAGIAMVAGFGQAAGRPDYGGGMEGYGERFAASYANNFTDIMIGGAILPSLLHQDPRYYYQGTGTKKSRALHAISNLIITKGDNGHSQPNYSSLGGDLASAAISNAYYPASDRGASLLLQNFAIQTGVHMGARLLQEFVFRPVR